MDNLWGVTIEDLKTAVNKGFTFAANVKQGWSFTRRDHHIWKIKNMWQTAEIDKHNLFINHKAFEKLQDALKREW